jgi:hypothetical protein
LSSEKGSGTPGDSMPGDSKDTPPVAPKPFKNDPEDPVNPNKEVERFREKLRP